jgi:transposase-like protein
MLDTLLPFMIIKLKKEGEVLDQKLKFYSEEFKEETVKLVLTSGKPQAQIGRELRVNS